MVLTDVVQALGLVVRAGEERLDTEVTGGCVSDMLSYVMGSAQVGNVWITIQVHPNIVGVASLLDLAAVVVADGQEPEVSTLEKAQERGVVVLTTEEKGFVVAGRLYQLLG